MLYFVESCTNLIPNVTKHNGEHVFMCHIRELFIVSGVHNNGDSSFIFIYLIIVHHHIASHLAA